LLRIIFSPILGNKLPPLMQNAFPKDTIPLLLLLPPGESEVEEFNDALRPD
jgi:hypothetical protein